ncbi:MAG: porin, partial [Roseobacter sp.]
MKKILMASTMLVATGGMAAADITFNGFGRFGLYFEENDTAGLDETRLEQRFRLNIVGTTETDGGVKFGARLRIETNDESSGRSATGDEATDFRDNENAIRNPEFNVQAGGFRLDVGNTSDVLDSGDVVDYFGFGVGLTSFLEQSSGFALPVSGIDDAVEVAPTIKGRYAVGDFTVAASYTDDAESDTNSEFQIGAGYTFGNYAVGIAYG